MWIDEQDQCAVPQHNLEQQQVLNPPTTHQARRPDLGDDDGDTVDQPRHVVRSRSEIAIEEMGGSPEKGRGSEENEKPVGEPDVLLLRRLAEAGREGDTDKGEGQVGNEGKGTTELEAEDSELHRALRSVSGRLGRGDRFVESNHYHGTL